MYRLSIGDLFVWLTCYISLLYDCLFLANNLVCMCLYVIRLTGILICFMQQEIYHTLVENWGFTHLCINI